MKQSSPVHESTDFCVFDEERQHLQALLQDVVELFVASAAHGNKFRYELRLRIQKAGEHFLGEFFVAAQVGDHLLELHEVLLTPLRRGDLEQLFNQ